MEGIIIGNISNTYKIETIETTYIAHARGKFKNQDIKPLVGDRVEIEVIDEEKNEAIIEEIKTRKNEIKRPKIANIDQIVFIISTKNPKPDLYTKVGYKVIVTSAKQNIGIDELKQELQNKTSVFSGNSGVGKSSIINALFDKEKTQEGEISKKNKKGKNTTTDTKLYKLEKDTYIADTPGFSSFEISEIESTELDKCFREFVPEIENCEFIGCTHIKEENCGIKKAIESEKISVERYERYCKIYSELKEKEKYKW